MKWNFGRFARTWRCGEHKAVADRQMMADLIQYVINGKSWVFGHGLTSKLARNGNLPNRERPVCAITKLSCIHGHRL